MVFHSKDLLSWADWTCRKKPVRLQSKVWNHIKSDILKRCVSYVAITKSSGKTQIRTQWQYSERTPEYNDDSGSQSSDLALSPALQPTEARGVQEPDMLLSYILASRSRFLSTNLRAAQTPRTEADPTILGGPYQPLPLNGNNMSVFTPSEVYQTYTPLSPTSEAHFPDLSSSYDLSTFGPSVRGFGHASNLYY